MVPVLHIVGVPSTNQQKTKPMLHHTLGDGRYVHLIFSDTFIADLILRYDAYQKAAELFTFSHASLLNEATAGSEIDRVLTDCITQVCCQEFDWPICTLQNALLINNSSGSPSLFDFTDQYHL
jgi:TPP-dependent 2-oxoacid decarboxylase